MHPVGDATELASVIELFRMTDFPRSHEVTLDLCSAKQPI